MADKTLRAVLELIKKGDGDKQFIDALKNIVKEEGKATSSSEKLTGATKGVDDVFKKLVSAGVLARAGKMLLDFGKASLEAASNAQEMQSKFDTVFGSSAQDVEAALADMGSAMNRSTVDMQAMASSVQDLFVPMGIARDEAADMSVSLTALAVDVASFNNAADDQVMLDFQRALIGGGATVAKYGIVMTEASVKQKALELGLVGLNEPLTENAKLQARLAILYEDTSDAQGDAIRTADSYENSVKGMNASVQALQIAIGTELLPAMTALAQQVAISAEGLLLFTQFATGAATQLEDLQKAVVKNSDGYEDYVDQINDVNDELPFWIKNVETMTEEQFNQATAAQDAADSIHTMGVSWEQARTAIDEAKPSVEEITEEVDGLAEATTDAQIATELLNGALGGLNLSASEAAQASIALRLATGEINTEQAQQLQNMITLQALFNAGGISQERFIEIAKDGVVTLEELGTSVDAVAKPIGGFSERIGGAEAAMLGLSAETEEVGNAARDAVLEVEGLVTSLDKLDGAEVDAIVNIIVNGRIPDLSGLTGSQSAAAIDQFVDTGTGAGGDGSNGDGFFTGSGHQGGAVGADFRVPGTGGVDSQLVAFRATPGERVQVGDGGPLSNRGMGGMGGGGVNIQQLIVQTAATNADQIAREIMPAIQRETNRQIKAGLRFGGNR